MIRDLILWLVQTAIALLIAFVVEAVTLADERYKISSLLFNGFCTVLYFAASVSVGAFVTSRMILLSRHLPFGGIIDLSHFSPHGAALLLTTAVWFSIHDFFYYWMHRLQHHSKWLWAEHELHHSDEHMNATTSKRHHWLEIVIETMLVSAPLILIFRPPMLPAVTVASLSTALGLFIHLNSRISFGWLNRVIATPSVHRIHHSKSPEHIDKNFAAFFPVWDVLFGTYFAPDGSIPETGLASGKRISSLWEAVALPFISWAALFRQRSQSCPLPVLADMSASARIEVPSRANSECLLQHQD